jgi:hypothetical protein
MNPKSDSNPGPHRVVIVGAGFAGLAAARKLASAPADILVIDRHNYNLFQPLLYQVATAGLSPADIAAPMPCLSVSTPPRSTHRLRLGNLQVPSRISRFGRKSRTV